jgi:malonyl CoA-acyl carrier protein transacylase
MTLDSAAIKSLMASQVAMECLRAGMTYERVRQVVVSGTASSIDMAEYELHKARAKQVLDNMRRAKQ